VISVATPSLSVVIPVRDEAPHLPATITALLAALETSDFDAELVVVDDGSTDGSADAARSSADGRVPVRIVRRAGEGRFEARRAGLEAAQGNLVLLLDARVRLAPEALRFVRNRVGAGESVWNGHVEVDADTAFGVFWRLLAELAWRDYFDQPRTTSFGVEEFDRFPKGTTCFLAPRELLLSAFSTFRTRYRDPRLANDDTPILRAVAARERIGISPSFACIYSPRTTLGRFLRHAVHRGTVFVDGHGTPASRFFPAVVAFFPLSAALAVGAVRRPALVPAAAAACGLAAAAYGVHAGRSRRDVAVLATVTPIYALGHSVGMWRGAVELLRGLAAR
jgi:glycosyltransferase involved in cell wall biosynthesis